MNDEPALLALYDLESHVLPHLETINQVDPAVQHCLEEARTLLRRAQDILQAAVLDPQAQYEESQRFYRALYQVLPLMIALESSGPPLPDQDEVGSLPDTLSSDLSDEDSFDPATPPHHLES